MNKQLGLIVLSSVILVGQGCGIKSSDVDLYRQSYEATTDQNNKETRIELDPRELSFTHTLGTTECQQTIGKINVRFLNFDKPANKLYWTATKGTNAPWLFISTTSGFGESIEVSLDCKYLTPGVQNLNESLVVRVLDPNDRSRVFASSTLPIMGTVR